MGKFDIVAANVLAALALVVLLVVLPAYADQAADAAAAAEAKAVEYGRTIAVGKCARCHAVGLEGESTLPIAPVFRVLHERYDVETLAEALVEGIVTGHADMPEFTFSAEDAGALISYLKSLE